MSLIKIYLHAVWAVKYRDAVLTKEMKPALIDSIHGLLREKGHTPIITNYEPDHIHALFRFSAREDIGTTMQALKGGSSKVLNQRFFSHSRPFRWQGGYAAFSICPTHVKGKAQYVRDQEIIHANRRFEEEYYEMLAEHPPVDLDDKPSKPYWEPLADR